MRKLLLIIAVSVIVIVLMFAYFHYPNSLPTRGDSPMPPDMPKFYWDTRVCPGFQDVEPRAENVRLPESFTLSRGNTGVAPTFVQITVDRGRAWNASFRADSSSPWVTVTFVPSQLIIEPYQKILVDMFITASPNTPSNITKAYVTITFLYRPLTDITEGNLIVYFELIIT